jgi:cell division transport system permease protein
MHEEGVLQRLQFFLYKLSSARASAPSASPKTTPIVPVDSIAVRALVAVIAIMTFLASLTLGAVVLVGGAAGDWQQAVAQEITIQIRPVSGRDLEGEVAKAEGVARAVAGVSEVRVFSKEDSQRLLEPWLGRGLSFDDLPVPRLIVLSVDPGIDLVLLRKMLAERVAGATLDDHRRWIERMRTMSRTLVAIGLVVLFLVFAATTLSVAFATRGAMATNRPIVEVLHFVGARDSFVAGEFQRHFLMLGFVGGAVGGGLALLMFLIASFVPVWLQATPEREQIAALFGTRALGFDGYAAIVAQAILIAAVTAITSRLTVHRTLRTLD